MKKALIVYGGWDGHHPEPVSKLIAAKLAGLGYEVDLDTDLVRFEDAEALKRYDLLIPNWTMGEMSTGQAAGLQAAVESGVGLAGWHGGMGDAFRTMCEFQMMVGGQFVGHPGNVKTYTVDIADPQHEITRGMSSFEITSEQYYMHIDPAVHVIASTVVNQPTCDWLEGTVMPVAWVRPWGRGRVFYNALGHQPEDYDVPGNLELTLRGLQWATR